MEFPPILPQKMANPKLSGTGKSAQPLSIRLSEFLASRIHGISLILTDKKSAQSQQRPSVFYAVMMGSGNVKTVCYRTG